MAKKPATGNKSAAIREALAAHPDKEPSEIAAILKAQGHIVTTSFISVVKSTDEKKAGGNRVVVWRKLARPVRVVGQQVGNDFAPMQSALEFIQACCGLEQAKSILATVDVEGGGLMALVSNTGNDKGDPCAPVDSLRRATRWNRDRFWHKLDLWA